MNPSYSNLKSPWFLLQVSLFSARSIYAKCDSIPISPSSIPSRPSDLSSHTAPLDCKVALFSRPLHLSLLLLVASLYLSPFRSALSLRGLLTMSRILNEIPLIKRCTFSESRLPARSCLTPTTLLLLLPVWSTDEPTFWIFLIFA